jgi:hypothetical protein
MKKIILLVVCSFSRFFALADEGMWLPQLLQALNEADMKKRGMKISAADIYSINKGSLKDAIVSLGGFCTAEVISDQGLLLTNHHCGFDAIQNHSSVERNLIQNGFWASGFGEELTNPGLTATFIVRIEDVSAQILKNLRAEMTEKERTSEIEKNITAFRNSYKKEETQELLIRSFFEGNRYYLFVTETFRDVRLVGAPPSSIGNFGKDTDNWMWPRHTGDFSLFRIYANKDNKPAAYSPDNIPYKPKRSLKISLSGVKEGDFTMVFGFPGRTMQYLPAAAVKQIMTVNDPARIAIRDEVLRIMDGFMRKDEKIRIQYAAKYASIQNAYKKWKGEVLGLESRNAIGKKQEYEKTFMKRVNANAALKEKYGKLLPELNSSISEFEKYGLARDYYSEIMPRIELLTVAGIFQGLLAAIEKKPEDRNKLIEESKERLKDLFKEYDIQVDKTLFTALISKYAKEQRPEFVSNQLAIIIDSLGDDFNAITNEVYLKSDLHSVEKCLQLLELSPEKLNMMINGDPAMRIYRDMTKTYAERAAAGISEWQTKINKLQRSYMAAQMEVFKEKKFYPDANSTLRVAYGNVKGYKPKDAVKYNWYTYLDGVMEKYKPGDYEFDVPAKLRELYEKKDYGRYGIKGKMPVCLIASNHTTGGNSGSPVMNANGELIGLNFDRVWEGTMSDLNYDPEICRNVMVDIRYVMFIIDKFAGAQNLVKEIKTVN